VSGRDGLAAAARFAAAVALCAAWLAGCGPGRRADPTTIRIAVESDPATLDPALSVDVHSGRIGPLIAPGLVRFGRDLQPAPDLAFAWDVLDSGRAYRFTLRQGARFSDGTPVTSDLVKRSFERLLDPRTRSPRQWVLSRLAGAIAFRDGQASAVSGIETPDPEHVILRLEEPFAPFLSMLAMPQAAILPASFLNSTTAATLSGAGPWAVDSWSRDDRIVLRANRASWRPPRAERLEMRILPEPAMQMTDFEAGRLDIVQIPQADLARVRAAPPAGSRLVSSPDLAVYYVGLSNDDPRLSDPRVRRALNMAVDLDALVKTFDGAGVRAHGAIPPGLPGYDSDRRPYAHDPAAARALLAEAGYADGFALMILQREGSRFGRALLAIQSDLAAVGVRVSIQSREWGTMKETIDNGKAEAFLADWYADYPDGENFLFPLFHSRNKGGGGNRARYRSARVDSLIERAQSEPDAGRRAGLYREADGAVYDDAPWIYLWHPVNFLLVREELDGYEPHPLFYGQDFAGVSRKTP